MSYEKFGSGYTTSGGWPFCKFVDFRLFILCTSFFGKGREKGREKGKGTKRIAKGRQKGEGQRDQPGTPRHRS